MKDERQRLAERLIDDYTSLLNSAAILGVEVECVKEAEGNVRFLEKHGIGGVTVSENKAIRDYGRIADEFVEALSQ